MRIGICGGGPSGLYLAILMRRAGDHEVTVYERDPPGNTYGWGVVFSEESLAELRDADYETYLAIDRALVRWSAIDIYHGDTPGPGHGDTPGSGHGDTAGPRRGDTPGPGHHAGRCIRSHGHGFSAIARTELLRLLAERARAVGADVRHEHPIDPELESLAGCDVIVGADGARSIVRTAHEASFRTTVASHRTRFVWFGADVALPVFTFIFRPTDMGLFQVHAYPFDASMSTFIVECGEETWRRAGLDATTDEEGRDFCQELFAPWLGEHRLHIKPVPGRSIWNEFVTLRNRSWHHDNVVLLGDAAHTAHFSIGSGTRLALDDAIALAKAFIAHPRDRAAAFAAYEGERQPIVERFQEVATDSAHYFESVGRYLGFAPEQFAFNLLTRSGRITHLELTRRDPAFVNRVDRWFSGAGEHLLAPPPALTPLRLAPACELPNRVALAPAAPDDAVEGLVGDSHAGVLTDAALLGAGLVVTEPVAPSPEGRVTSGSAGIWTDAQAEAWAKITDAVHREGTRFALRLTHAGRRGATAPRQRGVDRALPVAWPLLAASPLPYTPRSRTPRAIDRVAMEALARAYAAATTRAEAAGFDVLILDMADGYLLAGFLSPLANRRTDDDGGPLEARARFPFEILAAVRAAWPEDRPLAVRLVADDRSPGGLTPADGVELARRLAGHGVAFVDVTAGHSTASERAAPDYRRLYNAGLADQVRNEAGVAVMASGHITRLDEVNTLLAAGRADLCLLDPRLYVTPATSDPAANRRSFPGSGPGFERQKVGGAG